MKTQKGIQSTQQTFPNLAEELAYHVFAGALVVVLILRMVGNFTLLPIGQGYFDEFHLLQKVMIENIIYLLVVNTLLPYLPIPPALLLPAPLALPYLNPPSAFQNMNLTRLYRGEDFKRTFRESLKVHHPDHGGRQEVFQQIQGLKKIMQEPTNYYDLYNVTDADLSTNSQLKIKDVVEIKSLNFYVELIMFYFIAILYILAFTLEDEARKARKFMLAVALLFLAYDYYVHQNPSLPTAIDLVNDKIPLFHQTDIIKKTLIILVAIIRSIFLKRKTDEKILSESLAQQRTVPEYKDILERLMGVYRQKAIEKQKYEKSIWNKLRGYISKGVSAFFLLMVVKNALHL